MKAKISVITLGVEDLDRSIEFYQNGLGFPREGNEAGVAFFKLEGTWLGLFPRTELAKDANIALAERSGFPGFSLAHNVTTKEEVEEVLMFAKRAGAHIVKPAQDVFWGGYSGYFSDPDGFLWEVAWNPHMDLA